MTIPTQAQIEAAAKVLARSDPEAYLPAYYQVAEAALTAAAEVGEPTGEAAKYAARNLLRHGEEVRLSTIERCAQIVDKYGNILKNKYCRAIAAEIRMLMDQP